MKMILSVFLFFLIPAGFAHELAITFDDLSCSPNIRAEEQADINHRIINALTAHKVPAIGFVNEGKLFENKNIHEQNEKTKLLKLWVDNGFDLGNHTYSHSSLSTRKPEQYKREVIKGSRISKQLMQDDNRKLFFVIWMEALVKDKLIPPA